MDRGQRCSSGLRYSHRDLEREQGSPRCLFAYARVLVVELDDVDDEPRLPDRVDRGETSESLTRAAISDGRRSVAAPRTSPYRYMLFSDEAIRVRNHTAANKQTKSNSGRSTRLVARTGRNPPMNLYPDNRTHTYPDTPNHDFSLTLVHVQLIRNIR